MGRRADGKVAAATSGLARKIRRHVFCWLIWSSPACSFFSAAF